ncbi:MAG: hypothetical protein RIT28_13 [Pseudomonadota bacterium]
MSSAGPKMDTLALSFTLNGAPAAVEVNPKRPALDVLREDLDQRCLKAGCSPQGICGCCVALVDGKVRLTCTLPARSLQGKEVRTLDGLSEATRAALGQAFAETGGTQCGYCTPGIAVQAAALLERSPDPAEDEVKKALNMHLCRCTGWGRVVEAIQVAGAIRRGEARAPTTERLRLDAAEMTLGQHPYVDDLCPPGLAFAALVFAPVAVGALTGVDVAEAAEAQGVIAVWTAAELPPGALVAVGEALRSCGDLVAVVIADTKERAGLAADRVKVTVEARPAVTDLQAAAKDPARLGPVAKLQRGALNTRLNEGGLTLIKETFTTQALDPAFLEPEAALAQPTFGGGLTLFTCDGAPGEEAARVAAALGITPKVVSMPTGGAFGAKSGLPLGLLAAAAAQRLNRPVKLTLALEDGVRLHPKAPAMSLRVMLAGDSEGRLVGLKVRALVDLGGRPTDAEALIQRIAEHMTGAYRVPHVEIEVQGVRTDNPSAGPVRGAGLTGVTFAVEGAVDQLAARLGLDPLTLRSRSALRAGDPFGEGALAEDPGVEALLRAVAPKVEAARAAGHTVGLALAVAKQDGGAARVRLEPRDDGRVSLRVNVGEGGQGLHTALVVAAAAASNLSPDTFEVLADLDGARAGDEALLRAAAAAGATLKARPDSPAEATLDDDGTPRLNAVVTFVTLDATGKVLAAESLGATGPDAAPTLAVGQLEGGLMWGLGAALVEELLCTDGLPDVRIRNMGLLKAPLTPPLSGVLVPSGDAPRALGEVASLAAAPAVAAALAQLEGKPRVSLPMRDNEAAWSVGAKRPRGGAATGPASA